MNNFYVYAHINPVTNQFFYIGKGKGNRCYLKSCRNRFWHNTVNKYGYAIIKLVEGLTEEQAFEIEIQYIKRFGLRRYGGSLINLTYGGEGATGARFNLSEETKAKMRVTHTGMKLSPESIEKGRISKLGAKNPNYGKKTWNFGIPRTEAEKLKMSVAKIGIKQDDGRKAKSLDALEKAHIAFKEKMLKVFCPVSGATWKNKFDCIESLKITNNQFKDRVRTDRGVKNNRLEYIK